MMTPGSPGGPSFSGGNDPVRSAALTMLQRGGSGGAPAPAGAAAPGATPGAGGSFGSIMAQVTAAIVNKVQTEGWTDDDSAIVAQFMGTLQQLAAPFQGQGGGGAPMPGAPPAGPPATGIQPAGPMMAQGAPTLGGPRY
jgi:hypothetical protein